MINADQGCRLHGGALWDGLDHMALQKRLAATIEQEREKEISLVLYFPKNTCASMLLASPWPL